MDTSTTAAAIATAFMAIVAFQAWRLGNDRRDVALLGGITGLCGLGGVLTAVL